MLLRLFADGDDLRLLALHLGSGKLEQVGVVAARQSAVARNDDVQAVLDLTRSGINRFAAARCTRQMRNRLVQGVEVRSCTERTGSFAWRILEDATSSIALVICMVDCTDLIRRLMSFIFPEAIFSPSLSR